MAATDISKITLPNGTTYDLVDDSAAHIQSITTAQWNELSPEEKASGDYVITDPDTVILDASHIPYSNTASHLDADDVQEAVDEVDAKVAGLIDDTSTASNKAWSSNKISTELVSLLPVDEVSGAVANFDTDVVLPLIDVKAEINAVETGTGAKSPSNPYVISGFTGDNLYHCGGNFFNKNSVESGKLINASGSEVSYADWNLSDYIEVIEGASYYFYGLTNHPNTNQDNIELFDENKNKIGFANVKTYEQPYLIPNGVKYIKCSVKNPDLDTAQFGVYQNLSYCPYSPEIEKYIINLGQTVYGGEIVLTKKASGYGVKLRVTHGYADFGDLTWGMYEVDNYNVFYASVPKANNYNFISSIYPNVKKIRTQLNDKEMGLFNTNNTTVYRRVTIRDDDYSNATAFKTARASGQLVYELATPIEIDLSDASDIVALLGTNNLWSDTNGDTTVKYKLGIQKYIDKKIAEVQALVL